ncbi:MAG: HD domain-containing protein, partial [Rhodocyclaceae bacterium]|nr:HD domain-containing protein [Rhodocyclaceae bacterium]
MSASAAVIEPHDNGKLGMSHATSLLPIISTYLKPADIEKVQAAFEMARAAHEGQSRKSGEPYITHPLAVATILAQWHLDAQALIAAILHDVVEDTPTTKDDIAKRFGQAV